MRHVRVDEFLTQGQITHCVKLWNKHRHDNGFHRAIIADVLQPNMQDINKRLGQENDARYLAYVIEFALLEMGA